MRLFRKIAMAAALSTVLFACGTETVATTGADPSVKSTVAAATAAAPAPGKYDSDLNYFLSGGNLAAADVANLSEKVTAGCMKAKGWSFTPTILAQAEAPLPADLASLRTYRVAHGFTPPGSGQTTVAVGVRPDVAALSSTRRAQYNKDLFGTSAGAPSQDGRPTGGCALAGQQAVDNAVPSMNPAIGPDLAAANINDSIFDTYTAQWSSCMAIAGFAATSRAALFKAVSAGDPTGGVKPTASAVPATTLPGQAAVATDTSKQVAVADLDCYQQYLAGPRKTVEDKAIRTIVKDFPAYASLATALGVG